MAVTARVEVLPESEPVSNLLLRHATVSGAARAPVGRADPKDGESWNWGNRSRRPCIALSRFCYRRRKTLAPQGPRKLPKLDVAGSTPVARSRESADFSRPSEAQRKEPHRKASLGAGNPVVEHRPAAGHRHLAHRRHGRAPDDRYRRAGSEEQR